MRNAFIALVMLFISSFSVFAEEAGSEKMPTLGVEAQVSRYIPATEGYVLFLMEESAPTMSEAKLKFDDRLQAFSAMMKEDFSDAALTVVSVNIGTRDFNSYGSSREPVSPTIAKVLIFTIPPDELLAVKLLDAGIKFGIMPFCATSRDGIFGAVHYGVPYAEEALDELYLPGAQKLRQEADKLAALMDCKVVKLCDVSRYASRIDGYELCFRDIRILLPAEFCGSDKDQVKISLRLRGNFEVSPAK